MADNNKPATQPASGNNGKPRSFEDRKKEMEKQGYEVTVVYLDAYGINKDVAIVTDRDGKRIESFLRGEHGEARVLVADPKLMNTVVLAEYTELPKGIPGKIKITHADTTINFIDPDNMTKRQLEEILAVSDVKIKATDIEVSEVGKKPQPNAGKEAKDQIKGATLDKDGIITETFGDGHTHSIDPHKMSFAQMAALLEAGAILKGVTLELPDTIHSGKMDTVKIHVSEKDVKQR